MIKALNKKSIKQIFISWPKLFEEWWKKPLFPPQIPQLQPLPLPLPLPQPQLQSQTPSNLVPAPIPIQLPNLSNEEWQAARHKAEDKPRAMLCGVPLDQLKHN